MYLRLAIIAVIVTLLTATHWRAYVAGKQVVRSEMLEAVRKAENRARKVEQQLVAEKQQIEEEYAKRKKASDTVVRASRDELGRLRDELRSYSARQNSAACPRTDADPRDTIIRECSEAAQSVARVADENGMKLAALQSYVSNVCFKTP